MGSLHAIHGPVHHRVNFLTSPVAVRGVNSHTVVPSGKSVSGGGTGGAAGVWRPACCVSRTCGSSQSSIAPPTWRLSTFRPMVVLGRPWPPCLSAGAARGYGVGHRRGTPWCACFGRGSCPECRVGMLQVVGLCMADVGQPPWLVGCSGSGLGSSPRPRRREGCSASRGRRPGPGCLCNHVVFRRGVGRHPIAPWLAPGAVPASVSLGHHVTLASPAVAPPFWPCVPASVSLGHHVTLALPAVAPPSWLCPSTAPVCRSR